MKLARWKTLDIFKAMTVPSMVIVHNSIWWLSYHHFAIAFAMDTWFLAPRVLAFFVMLVPATAGAALFFYFKQHQNEELPGLSLILQRALFLSLIGFVMNYLAFGYSSMFQWNVLQFFSVSMVVVYLCVRFLNVYFLFLFGLGTLFFAPLFRSIFLSPTDIYAVGILIGSPNASHLWPFFPWFSIIVIGFVIAFLFHKNKSSDFLAIILLALGTVLMLLANYFDLLFYSIDFKNLWGEIIFQPPTMQILGTVGVLLFMFGLIHLLFKNINLSSFGVVATFSAGLSYIYIFHMIAGHQIQLHFLKENNDINLLWLVIVMQLIAAYLIGVFVQYLKLRNGISSVQKK